MGCKSGRGFLEPVAGRGALVGARWSGRTIAPQLPDGSTQYASVRRGQGIESAVLPMARSRSTRSPGNRSIDHGTAITAIGPLYIHDTVTRLPERAFCAQIADRIFLLANREFSRGMTWQG